MTPSPPPPRVPLPASSPTPAPPPRLSRLLHWKLPMAILLIIPLTIAFSCLIMVTAFSAIVCMVAHATEGALIHAGLFLSCLLYLYSLINNFKDGQRSGSIILGLTLGLIILTLANVYLAYEALQNPSTIEAWRDDYPIIMPLCAYASITGWIFTFSLLFQPLFKKKHE